MPTGPLSCASTTYCVSVGGSTIWYGEYVPPPPPPPPPPVAPTTTTLAAPATVVLPNPIPASVAVAAPTGYAAPVGEVVVNAKTSQGSSAGTCTADLAEASKSPSTATCAIQVAQPGIITLVAAYMTSGFDADSASRPVSTTVMMPTETTLAAPATVQAGQAPSGQSPLIPSITFTATVTPKLQSDIAPTGSVTVVGRESSGLPVGSCTATLTPAAGNVSNGSCSFVPATPGTISLVATYPGAELFVGSSATATTTVVAPKAPPAVPTTITVTTRPGPKVFVTARRLSAVKVALIARVTAQGKPVNGGTFTFELVDPRTLCKAVPVANGTAQCVADLAVGSYRIQVTYSGATEADETLLPSQATATVQVVKVVPPTPPAPTPPAPTPPAPTPPAPTPPAPTPPAPTPPAPTPPAPTPPAPVQVPPVHTGEPWAGWAWWALVSMVGAVGIVLIGAGWRRRPARAD